MTVDEWKRRAAQRLNERANVPMKQAKLLAETVYETAIEAECLEDGVVPDDSPESSTDEELSYWTD